MHIASMSGSEGYGFFDALREEDAATRRAGLLSTGLGGTNEPAYERRFASSDSLFISETARFLASGLAALEGADTAGNESAPFPGDNRDSAGLYSPAGYTAFARARIAARQARSEAAAASAVLLAPLPPGGDDPDGSGHLPLPDETAAAPSSDAAFAIARLQTRLRELQQELSAIEGDDLPEQRKATRAHSLNSRINQAVRDISGLLRTNPAGHF